MNPHITHFSNLCNKSHVKVATKVYQNFSNVSGSENTLLLYLPQSYALLFQLSTSCFPLNTESVSLSIPAFLSAVLKCVNALANLFWVQLDAWDDKTLNRRLIAKYILCFMLWHSCLMFNNWHWWLCVLVIQVLMELPAKPPTAQAGTRPVLWIDQKWHVYEIK